MGVLPMTKEEERILSLFYFGIFCLSSNKGMQVPLENFIALYPSIKDKLLQEELAKKTEFAELRLEKAEEKEGNFYRHQEILSRIVSPHTEYNEQLVYHGLGSGKCVHPSTLVNINGCNKEIESVWKSYGMGAPKFDNEGGEWKLPSAKLSVFSLDESSKKMCKSTISKLYRQRVRERLNVLELPGGTRLRMTKAHRVLTERGWTNDFSKVSYVAVPKAIRPEQNTRKVSSSLLEMIIWYSVYGTFLRNQDPRNFGLGTSPVSLSPLAQKDRGKFLFTFRTMREYMNFVSFANNFLMENNIGTDRELRPQKTTIRNPDGGDADVVCCGFRSGPLERFFSMHEFDYEMRGFSGAFADCPQKDFQKFVEMYISEHSKVDREGSMLLRFYNRACCLDFSAFLLRFGVKMTVYGSIGKICRRYALRLEEKIDMPLLTVKSIQKRTTKSAIESDPFPLPDFLARASQKLGVNASDLLAGKRNIENMSDARQVLLSLLRARQGDDFCPALEEASKTEVRLLSEELSQILEQEVIFVPIVSVSEEEHDGYVYDFEVQKNHNYLAEGIITHNTCTAISIASAFSEAKDMEKPLVFASTILQENFRKDLTMCASDSFPKPPGDPTEKAYRIALRRMTDAKFEFWTPTTFYHLILRNFVRDGVIDWELVSKKYSGRLIIIDEVQNLRQDADEEEGTVTKPGKDNVYKFMHTFLHRIKNSKIILLSGTPIVNEVWDLAYVMNLILPLDQQLPEEKGFERLLSTAEGKEKLQNSFRGRVSYLRAAATDTKRLDQGSTVPWIKEEKFDEWKKATKSKLSESSRPWTEHIRLFPSAMSKYQQESVERAETETIETEGKVSKKGGGFHRFGLDASLFVWPEQEGVPPVELYGTRGFERFATKKGAKGTYALSPTVSKKIKENLGEYSSKFKVIVDRILENPNKLIFVYTSSVRSGGALLFALILKLFGMKQANSGSVTSEDTLRRFAVLQGGMDRNVVQSILGAFTSPENKNGQKIQVLIASRILSQGVTLKNIREVHILTPHWQSPQIEQAIARSIRLGSHKDLKKSERNVKVFRHVAVNSRKGWFLPDVTPDILTYKTAETKAVKSAKVLRMMKQSAIDCPLNYARNVDPKDEDGSEACDFDVCDFGCNSARPENPDAGPEERYAYPDSDYDNSTYDLYYAGKEEEILKQKLIAFFGRNPYSSFQSLLSVFGKERLLLDVLSGLIDDRETILDSFGFPCYLAEENDVFYLVKSFGEDQRNFLDIFYVSSPLVTKKEETEFVFDVEIFRKSKAKVSGMCKLSLPKFKKEFDSLDHKVRITLFELAYSLVQKKQSLSKEHMDQLLYILQVYKNFIHNVTIEKKKYIAHLLSQDLVSTASYDIARKGYKPNGKTRVFVPETFEWKTVPHDVEEKIIAEIKKQVTKRRKEATESESLLGLYLAKDPSVFRVKTNLSGKKGLGVVCKTSIKIPLLFQILVETQKIKREKGEQDEYEEMEPEEISDLLESANLNYETLREKGYEDQDMLLIAHLIKDNPNKKRGKSGTSVKKGELCDLVEKELEELGLVRRGI
ncbi:putative D6/D11-like helicase [Brazilian marseillevirus]|uniref:putative D6/D11-like helicase n=1 Tax=Brazilian marseillevirus TaxID=1813599 RepID=UPI0007802247|nr:putative D6/D11-like helicase [Brazilian marseillevirus]AMQ10795.1 putative D6/D11-like helicase [Brazilian marseillevirus]